jgi:hypothetical protein
MHKTVLIASVTAFTFFASILAVSKRSIDVSAAAAGIEQQPEVARPWQPRFNVDVVIDGYSVEKMAARGRTYVEALPGREYELRINNPFPYRIAVAVSVDGLNSIDARHTSAWNASKWVVNPYETITVTGWQMSSSRARKFYFTSERDSYASKLGDTTNIGVISVVAFREREPKPIRILPRPDRDDKDGAGTSEREEAPSRGAKNKSAGQSSAAPVMNNDEYAATGIGRSVNNDVQWIHMELDSRPVVETSIRYEYYAALVKLGVLPRRYETDRLTERERARGFEDRRFSPEP